MDGREHGDGADGALEQLVHAAGAGGLGVGGPGGGEERAEAAAGIVGRGGGGVGQRDAVDAAHVHGRPAARLRHGDRRVSGPWAPAGAGRTEGREARAARGSVRRFVAGEEGSAEDCGGAASYNSRTIFSCFSIIRWWMGSPMGKGGWLLLLGARAGCWLPPLPVAVGGEVMR